MTRGGWLLIGALALGAAPAQAQTAANAPAPAPYEDRVIEGLAPLADENDGQNDYDRGGWPRYLRLETRLGNQSFDASRRTRLAYALEGLIETPNHGMLSMDGSVSPSPREYTLTLRQRALPLPGGWTGDHDLGVITAPGTDLSRLPSRVLLPSTQLRGLSGQWEHTGQGLQLLAAGGEPGQLTSQPVTGFQGLGGRRHLAGAQWRSPGARATEPDGWTLALQHERATDVLTSATLMDKVAVNRACKALEDRGLAARQAKERDGRSHHLELTKEGRAMHGRIMPLALEMEARLFESFTDAERQAFASLCARLRAAARELQAGPAGGGID